MWFALFVVCCALFKLVDWLRLVCLLFRLFVNVACGRCGLFVVCRVPFVVFLFYFLFVGI